MRKPRTTAIGSPELASIPTPGVPAANTGAGELFQLVRDGAEWTRAELAQTTGLARSTVASRVDRLLEAKLIVSVGEAQSSGGRPASKFTFNARSGLVMSVDVGANHLGVGLADLNGEILASQWREYPVANGPDRVLGLVVELGTALLAAVAGPADRLIGIGIGLPGPVEFETGTPNNPPIMPGWDRFNVPAFLRQHWDVPVLVDNDVNIMALGEQYTHWRECTDFMFIKLATGIGSGIISGGSLQHGANGTSGDIGHVRVPGGADVPCHCGNTGCLEALASGPALAARLSAAGHAASTADDVVRLATHSNIPAIHAVRQAGRDVGEVLAICVNMLNPSVIVVGGSLSRAGDQLLAGTREAVYRRSQPLATQQLRIEPSRAGKDAGILGASRLIIEHVLAPAAVEGFLSQRENNFS